MTLEPCNHTGRTPPCTEAILQTPIQRVILGCRDPNLHVKGGGAERLREAGITVIEGVLQAQCAELIRGFRHWILTGRPWVTVKIARQNSTDDLSRAMIPPPGIKTFTSAKSLRLAHLLRKQADVILTGSGTILSDQPEFTVRHVADHVPDPSKRRLLAILDRRHRVPREYLESARKRGLDVLTDQTLDTVFEELGRRGLHEVLVEAGPTLTQEILARNLWDEQVIITRGCSTEDDVKIVYRAEPILSWGDRPNVSG